MGLLWGKKKGGEGTPVIHKAQHNTTAPRVNIASNPNVVPLGKIEIDVEDVPVESEVGPAKGGGAMNVSGKGNMGASGMDVSKQGNGGGHSGGPGGNGGHSGGPGATGGHSGGVSAGSGGNVSVSANVGGHVGGGHVGGGNVGGGNVGGGNVGGGHVGGGHSGGPGGVGVGGSYNANASGNVSSNVNGMGGNNYNSGANKGAAQHQQVLPPQSYSPVERVVNLYGISQCLFRIARLVSNVQDWTNQKFTQSLSHALGDLDRNMRVLRSPQELRDWVHPLHYRKTGAVIGAGRRITTSHNGLREWEEKIKLSRNLGQNEQRYFRETIKEIVGNFVQLCVMVEMVVPADFNAEINELARTMRDMVDTASGKLNYVFDDVARICTTSSIRLSRLGMWKGLQVVNVHWVRQVNDTCFTVSKATKILYVIGQKLYENMTDRTAYDNLTSLTRGIVVQIKKLQEMVQVEQPNMNNMVITFTNEIIQEHLIAYDAAIKEVSISLNNYARNSGVESDMTINTISLIIDQLENIKESVRNPDTNALFEATASISEALEKFCASVYHVLHLLGDQNEVIKEQVMETMQLALHGCLQLQLVVICKGLYHNVLNPENTMLICIRFLLLSVSIIIDAVDFMKTLVSIEDDGSGGVALGPDEINDVIVYILHYGRPLFRGDGEPPPEPTPEPEVHVMHTPVNNAPAVSNVVFTQEKPRPIETTNSNININIKNDDDSDDEKPKAVSKPVHIPVKEEPKAVQSNHSPAPAVQQPAAKPEPVAAAAPAPAPAAAANKSWLDMTTAEFKDWCDKNGKPSADFNENRLPPGFEKPPVKPTYKEGSTREEYKAYMVAKYEYETWENKLVLFNIKLKKKLDEIK